MAEANADQVAFWGGEAGNTWVTQQSQMDRLLTPVLYGVLARADLTVGDCVMDVGCGTGQSTQAAGVRVGPTGTVLGADVSEPMLALARRRTAPLGHVSYAVADVADHPFAASRFDSVISRFGVMFFADPTAAFSNIARAMKPGAQMSFATWGRIEANPWFTLPARVGREMFGPTPKSDPDAPGPFSMRDVAKTQDILRAAGLQQVACDVVDMAFALPDGPRAMAQLCLHIGPAGNTLKHFDVDAAGRLCLEDALTDAFTALPDHAVPAQINFFTAVAA